MSQASHTVAARAAAAVIIPAYRPAACLLQVVGDLAVHFDAIVVVNDGSGPDFDSIFTALASISGVHVLQHTSNQGKGAALKTGISFALSEFPHIAGVVTADADGQHCPNDVVRVRDRFLESPDQLVLGSRAFDTKVPLRSRFGNSITRWAMRILAGENLADTQTGMRAIPRSFASALLKLPTQRYEFELDMLLAAREQNVPIAEERIRTVYETGNPSSHFNPILDSMRIYLVLLRFFSASLLAAVIDNLVFYLAFRNGANLWMAQLAGRAVSVAFNYLAVKGAVFYARDRHVIALPKYLTLVAVSGTIAYLAIQSLTASTEIPVLWAKILVESLLFFSNFAVQRLWVFRNGRVSLPGAGRASRIYRLVLWSSVIAAVALLIGGIHTMNLLDAPTWSPVGMLRYYRFTALCAGVSLLFFVINRRFVLAGFATIAGACTIYAAGPLAVASVALFTASMMALGRRLFGVPWSVSFLAGLAIWSFAITVTARAPIHYAAVYAALLIASLAIGRAQTRELYQRLRHYASHQGLESPSTYWAFCLLGFVLLSHWILALKPEVSTDGLAMHLAIAANIAENHAFTIDFQHYIWALMPMGADFLYATVYTLGGEIACRLLNFTMLASIVALLYRACRHYVSAPAALLMASLFASAPLIQLVTGSMLVDNFVTAMVLGAAVALWRFIRTPSRSGLLLCALLAGVAVSWKLGAFAVVAVILPLIVWAAANNYNRLGHRPTLTASSALALFLIPASFPYVNAYVKTGNPVFPFEGNRFSSPFLQDVLVDHRFREPLTPFTPTNLTFETSRYYEGQNGSFGFQYLLFLPLCIIALPLLRSRDEFSPFFIGLLGAALIGVFQPNARYFYVALPFLSIGAAVALGRVRSIDRPLFHFCGYCMGAAVALNLWFIPTSNWYHRDFVSKPALSAKGADEYRKWMAPVRNVVDYVNRAGGAVAFTASSEIAGVRAPVYSSHWHGYAFRKQVEACRRPADVHRLLKSLSIRHLISPGGSASALADPSTPAMSQFLAVCTVSEFHEGNYHALRIHPDCESRLSSIN